MRLTIDTTTIKFAAAGVAEPVLDFATKSQKTDEHSVPLFQVPVFSAGGGIKDAFTVKVAGEVKGLGCTYELRGREGVKRPGFHRGFDLHWVLLPSRLLNLGPSERLNSCQRLIPGVCSGRQLAPSILRS